MTIANVALTDTFADWVVKTNQLIVQYAETNALAANAYNTTVSVSFTAANIAADILSSNANVINSITTAVIASGNLANAVIANTMILNQIYSGANTSANSTATTIVYSAGYVSNVANLIIAEGSLANAVISNTQVTTTIYDNANVKVDGYLANTNINSAWTQANTARDTANAAFSVANTGNGALTIATSAFAKANAALANTSGVVFAGDLIITGNLTLSGATAVLNLL